MEEEQDYYNNKKIATNKIKDEDKYEDENDNDNSNLNSDEDDKNRNIDNNKNNNNSNKKRKKYETSNYGLRTTTILQQPLIQDDTMQYLIEKKKLQKTNKELKESDIIKVMKYRSKSQKCLFEEATLHNILAVGRSGVGKSTAINVMKNAENRAVKYSLFSQTEDVIIKPFNISDTADLKHTFNIIDTPGLVETREDKKQERTDEDILKLITKCVKQDVVTLHTIILFCSLHQKVHPSDVLALNKLIGHFGNKVPLLICITNSESHNIDTRINILNEIKRHTEMRDLLEKANGRIRFIGAIDNKTMLTEDTLNLYMDNILEDRMRLLDFLFKADKPVQINDLKFVSDKQEEIQKIFKDSINILSLIEQKEYHLVAKKIKESRDALVNSLEFSPLFTPNLIVLYGQLSSFLAEIYKKHNLKIDFQSLKNTV